MQLRGFNSVDDNIKQDFTPCQGVVEIHRDLHIVEGDQHPGQFTAGRIGEGEHQAYLKILVLVNILPARSLNKTAPLRMPTLSPLHLSQEVKHCLRTT